VIRETRQVRRGGCRSDDTFRDFDFATPQTLFFLQVQAVVSRRNMSFRRSYPSSHTTITPTRAPTPYRPNYYRNWTPAILHAFI